LPTCLPACSIFHRSTLGGGFPPPVLCQTSYSAEPGLSFFSITGSLPSHLSKCRTFNATRPVAGLLFVDRLSNGLLSLFLLFLLSSALPVTSVTRAKLSPSVIMREVLVIGLLGRFLKVPITSASLLVQAFLFSFHFSDLLSQVGCKTPFLGR